MPDISMCKNHKCPSKKDCWRYNATPWERGQTYMEFIVKEGDDRCESFWPMPETEDERYNLDNDLEIFIQGMNLAVRGISRRGR